MTGSARDHDRLAARVARLIDAEAPRVADVDPRLRGGRFDRVPGEADPRHEARDLGRATSDPPFRRVPRDRYALLGQLEAPRAPVVAAVTVRAARLRHDVP